MDLVPTVAWLSQVGIPRSSLGVSQVANIFREKISSYYLHGLLSNAANSKQFAALLDDHRGLFYAFSSAKFFYGYISVFRCFWLYSREMN